MLAVSSWGRLSHDQHEVIALSHHESIHAQLKSQRPGIAHGMGKSYGDQSLNPGGVLWATTQLDRFISFDDNTGVLVCEAGVVLKDIQSTFIPRGWSLPVTPGTQLITIGGAIANDVHGKNHHAQGTFGNHVLRIHLCRTDGTTIICGPDQDPRWFCATLGGMGLTGVIKEATIQLKRIPGAWLETETLPYSGLDEFFALSANSELEWEHTVSWFDCTSKKSRGIFMRAKPSAVNPAKIPPAKQLTFPVVPPFSLLNNLSVRVFNSAYYLMKNGGSGKQIQDGISYLYPLDNLLEWNRVYGPRGFFQYQSVVPVSVAKDATVAMQNEIRRSGQGSFLSVLKTFGNQLSPGMLSFPMPGTTLALDFPNRGAATTQLLDRLDAIVREAGGRIYAAKDARMPPDLFERGYPRLSEFLTYRDPGISSSLSRRLMGT
jgi:FAD/FMN-containing dehydrogenase